MILFFSGALDEGMGGVGLIMIGGLVLIKSICCYLLLELPLPQMRQF